jgi:hypothetical protein
VNQAKKTFQPPHFAVPAGRLKPSKGGFIASAAMHLQRPEKIF